MMQGLFRDIVLGIVRTVAASLAGYLLTKGYISSDQVQGLIGSLCFLAVIAYSAWDKIDGAKKLQAATVTTTAVVTQPAPVATQAPTKIDGELY